MPSLLLLPAAVAVAVAVAVAAKTETRCLRVVFIRALQRTGKVPLRRPPREAPSPAAVTRTLLFHTEHMMLSPILTSIALLLLQAAHVLANTEKAIFLAPERVTLHPPSLDIEQLGLIRVDPTSNALINAKLPRVFPSKEHPSGLHSWYLLAGLEPGRRYEARVSWAAVVSRLRL